MEHKIEQKRGIFLMVRFFVFNQFKWLLIIVYSLLTITNIFTWSLTLGYYGPLKYNHFFEKSNLIIIRTIMVTDYSEITILFILDSFINFEGIKSKKV